jgi:hypothetical protein
MTVQCVGLNFVYSCGPVGLFDDCAMCWFVFVCDEVVLMTLNSFIFVCSLNFQFHFHFCFGQFVGHIMFNECLMFEVHHGGRFNRENGVAYVGGDVTNYPDLYDKDELSFFVVETVVKCYGYSPSDIIYYIIPNKSLDEGLRLLSSDHDVIEMVGHHNGHGVVELYVVGFILYDVAVDLPGGEESVDEEYEEEYERNIVYRRYPFWNEVLSDDSDTLEVNADMGYGEAGAYVEGEDVGVDQEFVAEPSYAVEEELEAEVAVALAAAEES